MKPDPVNTASADPSPAAAAQQGVGLLLKAFQILDLFSDERPSWSQGELVKETGLARSTLSRLIRFLGGRGYLTERHGRYTLGFAAIDLGRRAQLQFNLADLCADLLEELAQATAETIMLTSYDEPRASVVCLAQIPSRQEGLRVFANVGASFPLHSGATAKAVLAFLPEHVRESVVRDVKTALNPDIILTPDKLRADLAGIRTCGYALSSDETYPGVAGLAVPLLTPNQAPLGSLGIAAPVQRITDETTAAHASLLLDIGRRAAARIAGAR